MRSIFLVALMVCCFDQVKSQNRQSQWVLVEGKDSRKFLPGGFYLYFTVQPYRAEDTLNNKRYDQVLQELQEFLSQFNFPGALEFVKRSEDDFSGRDNFGTFRLPASDSLLTKVSGALQLPGVQMQRSKYHYRIDTKVVRAEMTRKALADGKERASDIAKGMEMKLGALIYVQELNQINENFFDTESENAIQTVSVKFYLAFRLLPKK